MCLFDLSLADDKPNSGMVFSVWTIENRVERAEQSKPFLKGVAEFRLGFEP